MQLSFCHIVNPVKVGPSSDLFMAQPITFESMKAAKKKAITQDEQIKIQLVACGYPEDFEIFPDQFDHKHTLKDTIQDLDRFQDGKKLPFISEILQIGNDQKEVDYVIYTNVDIGLYPDFYLQLRDLIAKGFDAICINRNTLPNGDFSATNLERLYTLPMQAHEGIDCFVMHRELIDRFKLGDSITGTGPVGLIIAANLLSVAKQFHWSRTDRFTFHIGDDKSWLGKGLKRDSLLYFNNEQLLKTVSTLCSEQTEGYKSKVLTSIEKHVSHYLENGKLLSRCYHRQILAAFSDGRLEEVDRLFRAQDAELKAKEVKSYTTSKGFFSKLIRKMRF